jgi:hypothetical protein
LGNFGALVPENSTIDTSRATFAQLQSRFSSPHSSPCFLHGDSAVIRNAIIQPRAASQAILSHARRPLHFRLPRGQIPLKTMIRYLLFLASISIPPFAPVVSAADGGLTPDILESLRRSYKRDEVRFNALAANPIDSLVLNRSVVDANDKHFSHRIRFKGVTDQHQSGRCWLFAGLNTLRPAIIAKNKLDGFEFSQSYLQF